MDHRGALIFQVLLRSGALRADKTGGTREKEPDMENLRNTINTRLHNCIIDRNWAAGANSPRYLHLNEKIKVLQRALKAADRNDESTARRLLLASKRI